MRLTGPIPDHILSKMRPEDRPNGVLGMLASEVHAKNVLKAEKELQHEIGKYLRLLGIHFINPPMHKRSSLPTGWPDFTLTFKGVPVVWECKATAGVLSPAQIMMRESLTENGWQWRLIRNCGEAKDHLREIKS